MRKTFPLVVVAAALLTVVPAAPVDAADDDWLKKELEGLRLGTLVQHETVGFFPILRDAGGGALPVVPGVGNTVSFAEPDFPNNRYNVEAANGSDKAALVVGGTMLVGGERDRLVRFSRLVGPGATTELRALPAAATSDIRKEAIPFRNEGIAPYYLRKKADYGGGANTVPIFISRWLDFRNEGDERRSLAALSDSKALMPFCAACQGKMALSTKQPTDTGVVVGGIGIVHGRVQGLVLYGHPALLRAYFSSYLHGVAFSAAAIDIRARKAGLPMPKGMNDLGAASPARKEALELFERLKKMKTKPEKLADGQVGDALLIRTGGIRGRALGLDGRLVQLSLYPHDPFESAIYAHRIKLPNDPPDSDDPEDETYRPGVAELERRRGQGRRLTEYEKRLSDRLRQGGGIGGTGSGAGLSGGIGGGRRR